jgi:hypothetical protein
MSLAMGGFIDPFFASAPAGGVELVTPQPGGYTGPGNSWEDGGPPAAETLRLVNIQPVNPKEATILINEGGATKAEDMRAVYRNDGGTFRETDDESMAQILRFADATGTTREWRVISTDNRPWRRYAKAIVTRYRGER